jgi:Na+/H+-translocating membrane pyrophosphatase
VGAHGFLENMLKDPKIIVGLLFGFAIPYLYLYFLKKSIIKEKIAVIFLSPIIVGYILGPKAIGGLLAGSVAVGILFDILTIIKEVIKKSPVAATHDQLDPSSLIKGMCITSLLIIGFLV